MKVTRRDLLTWTAGAAAGLMVTPVPWKLLDDVSKWSQNWPWIPQPPRGPVEIKQSACTLCPRGCPVRVRMAGGWPVGVAGMTTHPITRGALCPLAYGAHQLNWHPLRLRTIRHRGQSSSWVEARTALAKACSEGPVIAIDGYSDRAASSVLETFAQKHGGEYRVVFSPETRAFASYEALIGVPSAALGYDLENAQTIVSLSAPLLDGWGIPGRFSRLWAERAAGLADPKVRLIQVESELSRTAARAWRWIPIHRGSEAALAAGLARALLEEHLVASPAPVPQIALAEAAVQTGLSPDAIRNLARVMMERLPAVAIANSNDPTIAGLNIVLGAVGKRGGIVRNSTLSSTHLSADAPIRSARAVLIDSSVPWGFTPQSDAEVFRFAAWDGGSTTSDWLLPAPGFLEELTDIPTAPTSAVETYAIAQSLAKARHETQSAVQFVESIDPALPTVEKIVHQRCADLLRRHLGTVYSKNRSPMANFASAEQLEQELNVGAVWIGEVTPAEDLRCELKEWPSNTASKPASLPSEPWSTPILPPLASKLYQESGLLESRRNA